MTKLDNSQISKVLGQVVDYPDQYDPTILVRELRSNNRQHLDIHDDNLPFVGSDTWNAYEVSTLTSKGLPVTGVLKIVYPCDSKYIVESKSIKLYLNSFNMFRNRDTREKAVLDLTNVVTRDLSELLETNVVAHFHEATTNSVARSVFSDDDYPCLEYDLVPTLNIDNVHDVNSIEFNTYEETPDLLQTFVATDNSTQMFRSALLKSNCRVTSQPDWGDVYVYIDGPTHVTYESMLKYIVSFRNECHFHEEICETIYKRLNDLLQPNALAVTCLYARRGGIDINPTRASSSDLLPDALVDISTMHGKTQKQ